MKSKRFWTLIVSAALLFPLYKIVQACGWEPDPFDYFPSFFQNGTTAASEAYTPFFYSRYLDYYDQWYDSKNEHQLPDANIAEWKTYTGGTVPEADLDSFIYKYDYKDLSGYYNQLEKGVEAPRYTRDDFGRNGFTKWFGQHKDLEALGYLMYAKQCEPNATSPDEWTSPKWDTARMARLTKNGIQLQKAAKQDFFKWRFAYQAMRMAFYAGDNKQALEIYSTLIGDKNDGGVIYTRCLGLKAGALFRTGHKAEAAYLYSRVFDLNDEEKKSAFISYDWSKGFENAQVLQMCKTPHERAVVHVMAGLNNNDEALPNIQAAYLADPQVKGLDVLMTREIQKAEERYQEPKLLAQRNIQTSYTYIDRFDNFDGNDAETKKKGREEEQKYSRYLTQLATFSETAASGDKVADKAFWHLASAYIALMKGDAVQTKSELDRAAAANMNTREHDLHDIINTVYIVKRADHITPAVESELLPSLKWLDAQANKSKAFDKTYRDLMSTVLVDAYLRDKDTVRAIYTLARTNRQNPYAYEDNDERKKRTGFFVDENFQDLPGALLERVSMDGLHAAQAFATGGGKTPYEQWLLTGTPYNAPMLRELEGTKYLRLHQFDKAEAAFKNSMTTYLPDPFLFYIEEVHEQRAEDSVHSGSKQEFAKKMAGLEREIAAGKASAQAQFDYGMGLYSMTYYGKASDAFTYYRSTVDEYGYHESPERKKLPFYLRDYYDATSAEQAFIKAANTATGAGLKSKSLWMAAKCWQKRCPELAKGQYYTWNDTAYYRYSLSNPYFDQLRQSSAGSGFYEDARSSCGYFRDYLSRRK